VKLSSFFRTAFFRLALIYVLTFGACSLIVFGVLYLRLASYTADEMRSSIGIELYSLAQEANDGPGKLAQQVADRAGRAESSSSYYLLQAADGRRIAGNLEPLTPEQQDGEQSVRPLGRTEPVKVLLGMQTLADGSRLAIGRDLSELNDLDSLITRAFALAGILCVGVAIIGGVVMSSRFLNRIELIRRTSETIVRGNLSERIPIYGSRDEMDRLAGTLNAMLDRIQTLMETTQQVSNDIAHDLRTPLTRLRHRLEGVIVRGRNADDFRNALGTAVVDLDDILATFAALLRIAEVEAGSRMTAFGPVPLSELMETLAETYAAVAEDAGQSVATQIEPDIMLNGDRDMLTQLVSNLVENAIRHCPQGATITLGLQRRAGDILLSVADNGPGIPGSERERVFRRFYRLERSRTTPGSGLGLPMVAAIAGIHGAAVSILDNRPGARFEVVFPRQSEQQQAHSVATEGRAPQTLAPQVDS
jgi:signal transduction histidine kinase